MFAYEFVQLPRGGPRDGVPDDVRGALARRLRAVGGVRRRHRAQRVRLDAEREQRPGGDVTQVAPVRTGRPPPASVRHGPGGGGPPRKRKDARKDFVRRRRVVFVGALSLALALSLGRDPFGAFAGERAFLLAPRVPSRRLHRARHVPGPRRHDARVPRVPRRGGVFSLARVRIPRRGNRGVPAGAVGPAPPRGTRRVRRGSAREPQKPKPHLEPRAQVQRPRALALARAHAAVRVAAPPNRLDELEDVHAGQATRLRGDVVRPFRARARRTRARTTGGGPPPGEGAAARDVPARF